MENFFKTPNLPDRMVRKIIIGSKYSALLAPALREYGVEPLLCPPNPAVDERLAYHADLSVLHLGENRFILAKYLQGSALAEELLGMGAELVFSSREQGREYPLDASLCALNIGGCFFHNERVSDPALLSAAEVVNVSQGYAKCAVCPIDSYGAITSDAGMARTLEEYGIDVFRLADGQVTLSGFAEGFIGGGAFKLSPSLLALTGRLPSKTESTELEGFLRERGIEIAYLTGMSAFDIGSAIPIC